MLLCYSRDYAVQYMETWQVFSEMREREREEKRIVEIVLWII